MGERQDREWVAMTPGDFDRDAPLVLNVNTGPATVPAEPDEYGTAPLFGETAPTPGTRPRTRRGRPAAGQERLF
ncbi:hypothetical protein ACIQFU_07485 [Streptomyces sp. NPDC093065]|uniref:hypothetical protein n=1 Tax=Streptomyces sp. NPDC093065 TaxID=3366021 RepID=UPI00381B8C98